ncbi:RNA-binding transcriptional accessory protein [Erysipelotrichaceae bacterium AF15-26LB]|nr:Tex-like protein N-terminal domain protein [Erysipelotrichaceae bacterium 3_1_53]MCR0348994.1 RNA-binding transcriptional accessory protein [[Clostridium] innocuum]RJV90815.1 RNA-binding transcriptional accessory protein [Erysipelotrichaceae bacterium AF15-26LB]RJV93501.1 RNA-binding transcriptional accessory protein [Erysipelotrichaceae bacterium AF19-24AC]
MEHIIQPMAAQLHIQPEQIRNTLQLLEEGNTVPFIARYRKEVTKGLDEEQIRVIQEQYEYQVNLEKRKEDVKRLIEQQGKLTDEIIAGINVCEKLSQVEDIYRPYQQKRKTRASDAAAKGLKPLADWLLQLYRDADVEAEARKYLNDKVKDVESAIQGAEDILAELASDDPAVRQKIRSSMERYGRLTTKEKKKHTDDKKVYKMYYDYSERISTLASHRIMAIDRGEKEKVLSVAVDFDKDFITDWTIRRFTKKRQSPCVPYIEEAVRDGLKRLAFPAVEREIRAQLSEKAHEQSIEVFSLNLERLLLQPPVKNKMVLGFDPAFRTGCKLAVVDKNGNMLDVSVIYPTPPNAKIKEAKQKMLQLLKEYPIDIIAIGNGTASRESEAFVASLIREYHLNVAYTIVSEAGASVYSASKLARDEFPELHVEQRSAISIARRILDPLSELIKIDPQSIGVGQYQHDLPTARLKERLDFVVSKAVNRVGVNVNTASQELLKNISGLSQATAKSIVEYRKANGELKNRKELKKIPKIGAKSYEQAAGFLRIEDGDEMLDRTSIHPESYAVARSVLQQLSIASQDMGSEQAQEAVKQADVDALIKTCESDRYTIQDILEAIATPLRDYRDRYDAPLLRSDVLELEDLHIGDQLEGVVRNVVDFGAFVDIGLHEDGLVHISKMSRHRVSHPSELVSVGDIVKVWVYHIDEEKQKVQLSLLPVQ